jgi:hypothetical protein
MKKSPGIVSIIFFAALIIGLTGNVHGQTLTFSQVLLVSNAPQTVPAGKVWKIESYLINNSSSMVNGGISNCGGSSVAAYMIVTPPGGSATNFLIRPVTVAINATSQAGYGVEFPVWLPAGSALASNCASWYLSVIEFNVVP